MQMFLKLYFLPDLAYILLRLLLNISHVCPFLSILLPAILIQHLFITQLNLCNCLWSSLPLYLLINPNMHKVRMLFPACKFYRLKDHFWYPLFSVHCPNALMYYITQGLCYLASDYLAGHLCHSTLLPHLIPHSPSIFYAITTSWNQNHIMVPKHTMFHSSLDFYTCLFLFLACFPSHTVAYISPAF